MASIYKLASGKWRAQVAKLGVRDSDSFRTRKEAEGWAAMREAEIAAAGGAPQVTPESLGTTKTVQDALDEWYGMIGSKADSARWNKIRLEKWEAAKDPLLGKIVGTVLPHDINEWQDRARKSGLADASVRRELNILSGAFTYAVKQLKWIEVNPCRDAEKPKKGNPRSRPLLTKRELDAIKVASGMERDPQLRSIAARVGAVFFLGLETGMRSGEILRARPDHYHRHDKVLRVAAEEKGGRKGSQSGRISAGRMVPLTKRAMELLDALLASMPKDQEPIEGMALPPYIVGLTDDQRDSNWRKIRTQAAVADLHFHDIKHEACTRLCKYLDVIALSHAVGTKDIQLLRDTYYVNNAREQASLLPDKLSTHA